MTQHWTTAGHPCWRDCDRTVRGAREERERRRPASFSHRVIDCARVWPSKRRRAPRKPGWPCARGRRGERRVDRPQERHKQSTRSGGRRLVGRLGARDVIVDESFPRTDPERDLRDPRNRTRLRRRLERYRLLACQNLALCGWADGAVRRWLSEGVAAEAGDVVVTRGAEVPP